MATLLQFGLVNAAVATLLAAFVALVERRIRRPALIHALWVLVLVKLVTPPIVKFGIVLPVTISGGLSWHDLPWLPWLALAVWGAGSACWFAHQILLAWLFQRWVSRTAISPSPLQQEAERLACEFGLSRCPPVAVVSEVVPPMLSGLGRRVRVVFPAGLLERLGVEARGTLLAHEIAHYARKDHWVRALELIVTGLYWWHPVVWWARSRIGATEEECCDARVIARFGVTPRVYAEAILDAIEFLSEAARPLPPIATGLGQARLLRQRLTQIMRGAAPHGLSIRGRLLLLVLCATLLPLFPVVSRATSRVEKSPPTRVSDAILLASPTVEIPREPS